MAPAADTSCRTTASPLQDDQPDAMADPQPPAPIEHQRAGAIRARFGA
jgi:hypothetical protein